MNTKLIHTNQHLLLMSTGEHEKLLAYLPLTPNAPVLEGVPKMVSYCVVCGTNVKTGAKLCVDHWQHYPLPKKEEDVEQMMNEMFPTPELRASVSAQFYLGGWNAKAATQKQWTDADMEGLAFFLKGKVVEGLAKTNGDVLFWVNQFKESLSTVTSTPVNFEPEWKDIGGEEWMGDDYSGEPFWNEVLRLKLNDAGEVMGTWKY